MIKKMIQFHLTPAEKRDLWRYCDRRKITLQALLTTLVTPAILEERGRQESEKTPS